ncbi:MAG: purine-nucleoside phosphorylase [Proteobacteria bacterium]|nr:purine-nucleoside phosphorylase [Pseudomonadota bacterium]MBU1687733.1 purine-nucleoside phosphorylase [Pseudomonadota bacterium]
MIDSERYRQRVEEAVHYLNDALDCAPEIVVILGSGLGAMAGKITDPVITPYAAIPGFPWPTGPGHDGNLVTGTLAGRHLAVLQGRLHYYEGYSTQELTLPLRVLALLGASSLIVTNAAGGLNPAFAPGSLMIIRDHLNFIPDNPLRGPNIEEWGPRFLDLSAAYDPDLIARTQNVARDLGVTNLHEGVYCAVPGPSLETPAETRYLRACGADSVGMSTVPEVIVARHAGMRVLGLSVIANVNDPDNFQPILLEDVLAFARQAVQQLEVLLFGIIPHT